MTRQETWAEGGRVVSDRVANAVIAVVATVWTVGQLVGMFNITDFEPDDRFNGIFIGIVGGALIAKQRASGGGEHRK